jgi:hypothetical protein
LALALLGGTVSAQQRPALEVGLTPDSVPEAAITVRGLLTDEIFNAMESGFPLYVHYHVALREPGGLFGGRTAQTFEWDYVVLHNPVRNVYAVQDPAERRELAGRDSLARWVSRTLVFGLDPDRAGRFHYQVRVQARTLSDQDVDEAFAWLKGGANVQLERPGLFTRAARRLLVRVMPLPSYQLDQRSETFAYRMFRP